MAASRVQLVPTQTDAEIMLDSGIPVRVEGVRASRHPKTGVVYIDPVSALKSYYAQAARAAGFGELRDAALMSVLVAPVGGMAVPWVLRKYTLNKMLFYQWARAKAAGLDEAFPHDNFVAERKGPIPEHIDADLDRLEQAGMIAIDRHDPNSPQHQPWVINLRATEAARKFFDLSETWFRRITIGTKKDLILLNPAKLRARVHTEYPAYRRKYVEVDDS